MEPPQDLPSQFQKKKIEHRKFPSGCFADELPSGVGVKLIVARAPPRRGIPRVRALGGGSYAYQA